MKKYYKYLSDKDFLKIVDETHLKEQYVKITLLNWDEEPLEEIQGQVTGGSLNINGESSMRRTCNLSMVMDKNKYIDTTKIDSLVSINKKIYLEIGYKNVWDNVYTGGSSDYTPVYPASEYPIIWFPHGHFIMMNPSISHSVSSISLSAQLQDKMCLLNGQCGGVIPASTQFDQYETIDEKGNWIIERPTFYQIIQEAVNHFGGIPLNKIIISDLDTKIKTVMKWIGSSPLYLYNDAGNFIFTTNYGSIPASATYNKFEYGEDVGFIYSDFYCNTELIGNAGENVCTILDKIKNMVGNYEYFFDIDGNFRWQEKKDYLNTTHAKVEIDKLNSGDYLVDMSKGKAIYVFDNALMISNSNNPQFNRIKNDFVVWGIKKSDQGIDLPIRYHLAIDKKPKVGNIYEGFFYEDPDDGLTKVKVPIKYENYAAIEKNKGAAGVFYMASDTGQIYVWEDEKYKAVDVGLSKIKTTDWRTELYLQGTQAEPFGKHSNYYYTELLNEWPKLYDIQAQTETLEDGTVVYTGAFREQNLKLPSNIDFYLDFIDTNSKIDELNVNNIGRRTEVINDNDVNCIFEPFVPDYIIIKNDQGEETEEKVSEAQSRGQNFIQVDPSIYDKLAVGGASRSAYQVIRQKLHEYTSYNESITLQTIPIHHLEPNVRISAKDPVSGIYGDYVISSMSIPLAPGGTMSISARRALERI